MNSRQFIAAVLAVVLMTAPLRAARSFNGTSDSSASQNGANIGTLGTSLLTIAITELQTSFTPTDKLLFELTGNYNSFNGAFLIDTNGLTGPGNSCHGLYFAMHTSGSSYRVRSMNATPTAGVWHTYVFTMTSSSANWNLYIDGVAQTLTNCDLASPGTQAFADAQLCLMARGCNTSLFNAGSVAWWAVWRGVILSANEAQSLYACQNPWAIQPESLLHATWYNGTDSPEASYAALQALGQNTPVVGTAFTPGPPSSGCGSVFEP